MDFNYSNFRDCLISGFGYIPTTIRIAFISVIIGTILSLFVAIIIFYKVPVISQLFSAFFTVYRAIPMMVLLLIFHLLYVMYFNDIAASLNLNITVNDVGYNPIAYFVMTLGTMTGVNECFRGALSSVPKIQFEAAQSVGLTTTQTLRDVVLPQMFPVAFPSYISNVIGVLKGIPLLSSIGVVEIMQGSLLAANQSYCFLEAYTAVAIIYIVIIALFTIIVEALEKKIFIHQPSAGNI